MSQLKVNSIVDANAGNTATINGMTPTADSLQGFRNRIINGDMRIDQRNAGASVTPGNGAYTLDRWAAVNGGVASKFSVQRNAGSVTPPAGFTNYLGVTSLSAYSVSSSDRFHIYQPIEGLNVADLDWGTANARPVIISFRVYSSLTGTFGGSVQNNAQNRSYPFTFTVSSANTWTTCSVTIPGDTSGTWLTTNGTGINLNFGLGVGSTVSGTAGSWAGSDFRSATGAVSVVGTNGATFYITGVQLEVGSVATPFERRPYGTELALCQRYFQMIVNGAVNANGVIGYACADSSSTLFGVMNFQVPMRTAPTFAITATSFRANLGTVNGNSTTAPVISNPTNINARFDQSGYSGLSADKSGPVRINADSGYVAVQAEL